MVGLKYYDEAGHAAAAWKPLLIIVNTGFRGDCPDESSGKIGT
jgi:hypothetical protein